MDASESLYVILGVEEDASPEQIRSAYRKAALKTHPDRALPERKQEAEVKFKRVAEAYEVLSKPDTRRRYDAYGTPGSPPPFASRGRAGPSSSNFANTFFGSSPDAQPFSFQWESSHDSFRRAQEQRGQGRRPFGAVDPFELFNSMFERELRGGGMGQRGAAGFNGGSVFDEHPFFASHRPMQSMHDMSPMPFGGGMSMFDSMFGGPMGAGPAGGFGSSSSMSFGSNMMGGSMGGGNYASESRQTRTVNGRTETIVRRTDAQGNETVHTITPERQTVTVNGIEDPGHPLLQAAGQPSTQSAGRLGPGAFW